MTSRVVRFVVLACAVFVSTSLMLSAGAVSAPATKGKGKKASKAPEPKPYVLPSDWGTWTSDAVAVPGCHDRTIAVKRPDGKNFNAFIAYKCAPSVRSMWLTDAETGALVFHRAITNEDESGAMRLELCDVDSDGTADVVFVHGEVNEQWGSTTVEAILMAQGKHAKYYWFAGMDSDASEEFTGEAEPKKNVKIRKGLKKAQSKFPWE